MRVTKSITTGLGSELEAGHGKDLHLEIPTTPSKPKDRVRFNIKYVMGVFFICMAFAGIVAVCVTVYIECKLLFSIRLPSIEYDFKFSVVAKTSWSASSVQPHSNVTSICDFIVNGCNFNNTSVMSHLVNHTGIKLMSN